MATASLFQEDPPMQERHLPRINSLLTAHDYGAAHSCYFFAGFAAISSSLAERMTLPSSPASLALLP